MGEPARIATMLVVAGVLLAAGTLLSRATARTGVPIALLFLGVGMLAGSQGLGGIAFEDYRLSFRLGTAALVLILFDGGFNTPLDVVKRSLAPAGVLATAGVGITAALVGLAARAFGFGWTEAFLLGAIVSSTDAAVVFAALRASGLHLRKRVGATLELESGLNDPVAVILTIALTTALRHGQPLGWGMVPGLALELAVELVVGAGLGIAIGFGARAVLARARPPAAGLYPVLTVATAFIAFGLPTLVHGSGFLAVYAAAVVLGNGPLPYRGGLVRVHDAVAWLSQAGMFMLLGLLVFPLDLARVALPGLGVAVVLTFVARPAAAFACLLPFRFPVREAAYVGWVGLRGAVPIILATLPVLAGVDGGRRIFDVVFFVVAMNAVLPGMTIRQVTRRLGVAAPARPLPPAVLEIVSARQLRGELASFFIQPASAVVGSSIAELPFPDGSAAVLVVRGDELVAPRGPTVLAPGDHVYVFFRPEDSALVHLLFGRDEAE